MSDRKTISISEETWEEAHEEKGDRTWDEIVLAGANADSDETAPRQNEGTSEGHPDLPDDVLTEEHIPDIVARVERKVERSLETLQRGP